MMPARSGQLLAQVVVLVGLAAAAPLEPLHADDECTSEGDNPSLQLRIEIEGTDVILSYISPRLMHAELLEVCHHPRSFGSLI